MMLFIMVFASPIVFAQSAGIDYERVKIGETKQILCGLDLAPDHSYLAISSIQNFPFYKYDFDKRQVIQKFDVGNWYAGSKVDHSPNGQYIVLQQLFYIDFAVNKDREVDFEIIDASTGQRVKKFEKYHAVTFTPDGNSVVTLTAEEVAFWELPSGHKTRSFKVSRASNGLAVSPDGKSIVVSHHTNEDIIKKDPKYKKNKKAKKTAIKYKQQISVFDFETGERKSTIHKLYDIVYRLSYSPDGSALFVLEIPHMKAQATGTIRQTYISTINMDNEEPLRVGFTSQAPYEPDFKLSHDNRLFGVVSKGARFLELHIYDLTTGQMIRRFEQSYRLFEKTDEGMTMADSRISFVFLPDNKTVVMTMGNHLIYWTLNL
jgi:WD40 repeat protein